NRRPTKTQKVTGFEDLSFTLRILKKRANFRFPFRDNQRHLLYGRATTGSVGYASPFFFCTSSSGERISCGPIRVAGTFALKANSPAEPPETSISRVTFSFEEIISRRSRMLGG